MRFPATRHNRTSKRFASPLRIEVELGRIPLPELTFDEIREALDLSKSATSNARNRLQTIGTVVYQTHPGDRKRYFRKSYSNWERAFVERGVKYLEIRHLSIEALEHRDNEVDETRPSMEEMIDFLAMLEESMLDAYDRWKKSRTKRDLERTSTG